MKLVSTLLLVLACSGAYSQTPRTNDRPATIPDPGTVVFPRTSRTQNPDATTEKRPDVDLEYKQLILNADYLFTEKQFAEAISNYEQAMVNKPDQAYPKDQIIRCRAELQAQQKQEESYEDRLMRDQARTAHAPLVSQYQADSIARVEAFNKAHTVHFTGAVLSGYRSEERGISKLYADDWCSDFLVPGKYTDLKKALKDVNNSTFDAVVVPRGTRLVIYAGSNFDGKVLLDVSGPAVVNNYLWKFHPFYEMCNTETYEDAALQAEYPPAVRIWSESIMHQWVHGSLEIMAVP